MGNRMWMVRAGQGAALIGDYLSQGIVTVGWLYKQDMASIPDRDELERRLRLEYPDQTNAQIRSGVGQAGRFLFDSKEGDQVLSYDPSERAYHVGMITGGYAYRPELQLVAPDAHHQQTRPVQWTGKVLRDDLSVAARNTLGAIMTIFLINDDVRGEIDTLLAGTKPTEAAVGEPEENLEEVRLSVAENADEFIKDRLLELRWYEMQDLVAGILRGMGYKTRASSSRSSIARTSRPAPTRCGRSSEACVLLTVACT